MVKWRTGYIINHHLCFDQNTQHPAKKCLTLANQRFLLYEYPRQIALPIILMVLWKVASIQACQNLNTRLRTHISTPWWGPTLLQTLPAPFIFSYIPVCRTHCNRILTLLSTVSGQSPPRKSRPPENHTRKSPQRKMHPIPSPTA